MQLAYIIQNATSQSPRNYVADPHLLLLSSFHSLQKSRQFDDLVPISNLLPHPNEAIALLCIARALVIDVDEAIELLLYPLLDLLVFVLIVNGLPQQLNLEVVLIVDELLAQDHLLFILLLFGLKLLLLVFIDLVLRLQFAVAHLNQFIESTIRINHLRIILYRTSLKVSHLNSINFCVDSLGSGSPSNHVHQVAKGQMRMVEVCNLMNWGFLNFVDDGPGLSSKFSLRSELIFGVEGRSEIEIVLVQQIGFVLLKQNPKDIDLKVSLLEVAGFLYRHNILELQARKALLFLVFQNHHRFAVLTHCSAQPFCSACFDNLALNRCAKTTRTLLSFFELLAQLRFSQLALFNFAKLFDKISTATSCSIIRTVFVYRYINLALSMLLVDQKRVVLIVQEELIPLEPFLVPQLNCFLQIQLGFDILTLQLSKYRSPNSTIRLDL